MIKDTGGFKMSEFKKEKIKRIIYSVVILFLFLTGSKEVFSGDLKIAKLKPVFNIFPSEDVEKGFFVYPIDFKTNIEGEIFLIDRKKKRVLKYDKRGKFVKYIGRIGQGPGEYVSPSKLYVGNKKLYVYDQKTRRIHIYKEMGSYLRSMNIQHYPDFYSDFYVNEKDEVYEIWEKYSLRSREKVFGKLSNGKIENIKVLNREIIKPAAVMGGVIHGYSLRLFFRHGCGGGYVSNNMNREIFFYDYKTGSMRKVLTLKYKKEKISSEDRYYIRKYYGKKEAKKLKKYKPFYENLFSDRKNNIYLLRPLVERISLFKQKKTVDVYDKNGNFIYRVIFPEDAYPLFFENGYVYMQREGKDGEFFIDKSKIVI